jgi:hypothetical protein
MFLIFIHFIIQASSQLCTLPQTLDISYSICNGVSDTTGSVDGFSVEFCDNATPDPNCVTEILGAGSENGQTYTESVDASAFTHQVLDVKLSGIENSGDGLCLSAFSMNTEQFVSEPFWLESTCEESNNNPCILCASLLIA